MEVSISTLDSVGKKRQLRSSIAERLPHILNQLDLSRKDAQYLLDCSSTTVSNYLNGIGSKVSWLAISRLCKLHPDILPYLCGDISVVTIRKENLNRVLRDI